MRGPLYAACARSRIAVLLIAVAAAVTVSSAEEPARARDAAPPAPLAPATLALQRGDRIVLVGNTLAERQQHFNHFETLLLTRFPDLQLVVRNLGWSGDTLTLQPRPLNFGDAALHLQRQRADVVLAFFGLNESFDGEAGLPTFERDLHAYLQGHLAATYNGRTPPRVALVSPIAHERLPHIRHVDVDARNRELARYTDAMRRVAAAHGVAFVDLYTPTARAMRHGPALTTNGIHVNEAGDRVVGALLMEGLGWELAAMREARGSDLRALDGLRDHVRLKNEEFFRRWRPLNAEYVVGRRVDPFGSVSFPPEMRAMDERVSEMEKKIWREARKLRGLRYATHAAGTDTDAAGGDQR